MAAETGYRAIWEPNRPLYLGAIITLEKGVFTIQSDLKEEGIPMIPMADRSEGILDYTSNRSVKISTKLSGQAAMAGSALSAADAGFSIEFASEKAIVFQADKTRTHQLRNVRAIERAVVDRVNGQGKPWPKEWLIVTQLLEAQTATIIISYSRDSKIDLKARADVAAGPLKLANAGLNLNVVGEQGSHLKVIAQQGISPLYRAMGYRHPLFGRESLGTKGPLEVATRDRITREGFQMQPFDFTELAP